MSTTTQPWWKEPTRGQWFAFGAAWFGWVLDAFDFTIFILAMPRIGKDLGTTIIGTTLSLALTLMARLAGGYLAGAAADRWGRKLPLMLSIIWFALCDGAVAFAPSFTWVIVLRTLFGFGMGAEWASGTALAMESWPERSRGIASGVLQGSWAVGFFLASFVYGLVMPVWGWRALFIIAAVPALLVLPIRIFVPESDAWEKAHGKLKEAAHAVVEKVSFRTIAWGSGAMALGFGAYYALVGVYPTMLIQELKLTDVGVARLGMLTNLGMLIGSVIFGTIAGRRGAAIAIATPALLALPFLPLYVGLWPSMLGVGAFAAGVVGLGFVGVTPLLLTNLFPAASRARHIGLVYHVGSAFAAFVPMGMAALAKGTGMTLGQVIAVVSAAFLVALAALVVLGTARSPRSVPAEIALTSLIVLVLATIGCADRNPAREPAAEDQAALTKIEEVTTFGSNPAGLKMYRYVPAGIGKSAPLVVALHGCTQTAADYTKAGWNELADKLKFYVVYPEQTTKNNSLRCFNWYGNPSNLKRGEGENESIKQMVDKMQADGSIDPKRIFVTGLSAGGAQTNIMLATWPDIFSAGAPIAGIPYGCAETSLDTSSCMNPGKTMSGKAWAEKVRAAYPSFSGPWPRVQVWQGTKDALVNPSNEKETAKQWANVNGASDEPNSTDKAASVAARSVWNGASGQVAVEMYAVDGAGHGVPVDPASGCGTAGAFVLDAKICSTSKIAEFFGLSGSGSGTGTNTGPGNGSGSGSSHEASGCIASGARPDAAGVFVALALVTALRSRADKAVS